MDGNSKDQIDHMLGTTRQMVEYFRTSKVKKNESWYTLTVSFLKTIEYLMEVSQLNNAQFETHMTPLITIALQK